MPIELLSLTFGIGEYDRLERIAESKEYSHVVTFTLASLHKVTPHVGAWYETKDGRAGQIASINREKVRVKLAKHGDSPEMLVDTTIRELVTEDKWRRRGPAMVEPGYAQISEKPASYHTASTRREPDTVHLSISLESSHKDRYERAADAKGMKLAEFIHDTLEKTTREETA